VVFVPSEGAFRIMLSGDADAIAAQNIIERIIMTPSNPFFIPTHPLSLT
jgi:hypothetical protein